MKTTDYLALPEDKQNEYVATLSDSDKTAFLTQVQQDKSEQEWLDGIRQAASEKAQTVATALGCNVDVAVFVVDPLKDAAVAFIRIPDALQLVKLIRMLGITQENAMQTAIATQLVRTAPGIEGAISDARFMDPMGNYDRINDSKLNGSLLLRMGRLIDFYSDEFKKK